MVNLDTHPEEVLRWEIRELWRAVQLIERDNPKLIKAEELNKMKNGITLDVPINYFTEGWYELYPNTKRAKIKGHFKIPLEQFIEEKEGRENIMRDIIIKHIERREITAPRT